MKLNIFSKEEDKKDKKKQSKSKVKPENTEVIQTASEETASPAGDNLYAGSGMGMSVLRHIYTSEKSTRLIGLNQYVFKVTGNATKNEIKKDVSARYNVRVKDVRVINVRGKQRQVGRHLGLRQGYRKAVVLLQDGDSIDQAKP